MRKVERETLHGAFVVPNRSRKRRHTTVQNASALNHPRLGFPLKRVCPFFPLLGLGIQIREEIQQQFGTVVLIFAVFFVSKESDGVLEEPTAGIVRRFACTCNGGIITIEHRGNLQESVPNVQKIRIENLFGCLHGLVSRL